MNATKKGSVMVEPENGKAYRSTSEVFGIECDLCSKPTMAEANKYGKIICRDCRSNYREMVARKYGDRKVCYRCLNDDNFDRLKPTRESLTAKTIYYRCKRCENIFPYEVKITEKAISKSESSKAEVHESDIGTRKPLKW